MDIAAAAGIGLALIVVIVVLILRQGGGAAAEIARMAVQQSELAGRLSQLAEQNAAAQGVMAERLQTQERLLSQTLETRLDALLPLSARTSPAKAPETTTRARKPATMRGTLGLRRLRVAEPSGSAGDSDTGCTSCSGDVAPDVSGAWGTYSGKADNLVQGCGGHGDRSPRGDSTGRR